MPDESRSEPGPPALGRFRLVRYRRDTQPARTVGRLELDVVALSIAQQGRADRSEDRDHSGLGVHLVRENMEAKASDLRRVDPETGEVLERLEMPSGVTVSGLEADGAGVFYCGGAGSGKVRAVPKPKS